MYNNALRGIIYYIIAAISLLVGFALLAGSIFSFMSVVAIGLGIVGIIGFVVAIVVAFIFYVMAAKRLRITLNDLAQRTGEQSFATAGKPLYLGRNPNDSLRPRCYIDIHFLDICSNRLLLNENWTSTTNLPAATIRIHTPTVNTPPTQDYPNCAHRRRKQAKLSVPTAANPYLQLKLHLLFSIFLGSSRNHLAYVVS